MTAPPSPACNAGDLSPETPPALSGVSPRVPRPAPALWEPLVRWGRRGNGMRAQVMGWWPCLPAAVRPAPFYASSSVYEEGVSSPGISLGAAEGS